MRFSIILVAAFFMVGSIGMACYAHEGHEGKKKGEESGVPSSILAAFTQIYPHAQVKKMEGEKKDGVMTYEIKAIENGVTREIVMSENGTVTSVKENVDVKALPPAISSAITSAYPKAKIKEAEKVTQNGVAQYSVEFEVGETNTEVMIDEGGRIVSTKNIEENGDDKGEGHDGEKGDDGDKGDEKE
jgi:hypothetical protein